ncbi:exodeoxyribonuclease VII small subunit [Ethanoligenens harbinense]|nr:exodeoxyribonuclease VII small subunit [Ethanoligenens harbinense]AVQ97386.1 exodeoxyribonuclease VII small subunit [Ethanoligenens harbinense YUAN-3]AYF40043.1 exodeoxyribonuclease VII small subunit [Ethanoligenens harbinense]AYF42875.1 exodeoxyribonuclease VII small subunit [Ethanoligenens harbinense]QCN93638.1 exodeoxyribonuclease VII small subunit [Ethanoligenens harbinense]
MEKEPTFEEAMAQLEQIVDRLESGEETLDGSIRLFETGARLSALLDRKLSKAEQKIASLSVPGGQPTMQESPKDE